MKYLVMLGDGMADYPDARLNNKTPLAVAYKPCMDALCKRATVGLVRTVPDSMQPGSDNANLSVMGYNPLMCYTGRSPLEAVSMGVPVTERDITYRCNLVTLSEEEPYQAKLMLDYSAGEISTEEASQLIAFLGTQLQREGLSLHAGISYRHCLKLTDAVAGRTQLTPPHDISDKPIAEHLPVGANGALLLSLMKRSYELLKNHPVNRARIRQGKRPANSVWFWGEGTKPALEPYRQKFGVNGAVISAVDLIKGIGKLAQMDVIEVEGATGNIDTNFEGKAQAAIEAFRTHDYVYVHVEAPDECGHRGEVHNKVRAIELIDELILEPIVNYLKNTGEDFSVLVLPDHPTPLVKKTHVKDPVPFLLYRSNAEAEGAARYDEEAVAKSGIFIEQGYRLMSVFLQKEALC